MIVDMLDTSIRKVDRVGALYNTSSIIGLSLAEGSTRVVISNSIGVGVGRGLSIVRLGISTNSMVSKTKSMMDNRSMGNRNWVSYSMSNSMTKSKTNSMTKTSKKLRCRRGCSNNGGEADKGLKYKLLIIILKICLFLPSCYSCYA